jgi:hypothetical protein
MGGSDELLNPVKLMRAYQMFSAPISDVATDFATEFRKGVLKWRVKPIGPSELGGGGSRHLNIPKLDMIGIGGKLLPKGRYVRSSLVSALRQKIDEREILSALFL